MIGIEASAGIGGWVRNPGDTIQSHNQAEKAIELRYLLGGSDMVDGIKKGNEAEMNQALSVMKSEIKKARVDKKSGLCLPSDDSASCRKLLGSSFF